ncbi:zinc finger protein 510-like [Malaya genurostris]|uniref:zinc finger protein 510-like n=1 Tax=Malaya genurostris TaxID=325434 RepID=UPI0026F408FE|nr:zinc finger protein 510-like [Malaya genurostris]
MEFSITSLSCRFCLKKGPKSKHLSDPADGTTNNSSGTTTKSILDIYKEIAPEGSLQISSMETITEFYPQRICDNCEAQLIVAYEFWRRSIRSDKILQNIISFCSEDALRSAKNEKHTIMEESSVEFVNGVNESTKRELDKSNKLNIETGDAASLIYEYATPSSENYPDKTSNQTNDELDYVTEEFMDDYPESETNDDEEQDFYTIDLKESKTKTSQCPDCGKLVSTHYLSKHREIHVDMCIRERPFECDQCQARFTLKENLRKHMRIHSNEKRYTCQFCQEQFLHWASRRYHIASHHTGEKRYTCEYCGAKFRNSSHYSIHIRRHTGIAPYPCHLCDRSFITSNSLKLHLISHSDLKNFHCNFCSKSYKSAKSLRVHYLTSHEREKNYVCPLCNRAFSQNHVLKTHLSKNHPDYKAPPPGTIVNVRAVKRMREQLEKISNG